MYMVMSRDQNVEQSQDVMIYYSAFGSLEEFKYLEINLTDQNII